MPASRLGTSVRTASPAERARFMRIGVRIVATGARWRLETVAGGDGVTVKLSRRSRPRGSGTRRPAEEPRSSGTGCARRDCVRNAAFLSVCRG